ncbi:hypothetical protein E0493_15365 [Roseomonas sp. M0104]|uniref:Integrase catalytic domain-containing protein n=1 Tax=Teichococcus coralli TaxID=2545983 RepID=A0A845BF51_9PROT|nr:hypothetical protein [Pseudoroseomonas coralli]
MSRSGDSWDNAAAESFFSALKTERVARKVHRARHAARAGLLGCIERFHHPKRRHSAIGALSSMELEQAAQNDAFQARLDRAGTVTSAQDDRSENEAPATRA